MFLKTYNRYLQEKIEDDIENLGKDITNTSKTKTDIKEKIKTDTTTTDNTSEETNTEEEIPTDINNTPEEETTATPTEDTTSTDTLDTPPEEETVDPTEELELNKEILGLFDSFSNVRDKIKNIIANIDQLFFSVEKTETKIDLLKLKDLYNNIDTAVKIIIKKNITKDNIDIVKKQYDDINSVTNNLVVELEKIVNSIKTNI